MTSDAPRPTASVAAAFARLAATEQAATPWEARPQPSGAIHMIRSVCNWALALSLLMALGVSIFAFLQL
jgi:hypothetical protein